MTKNINETKSMDLFSSGNNESNEGADSKNLSLQFDETGELILPIRSDNEDVKLIVQDMLEKFALPNRSISLGVVGQSFFLNDEPPTKLTADVEYYNTFQFDQVSYVNRDLTFASMEESVNPVKFQSIVVAQKYEFADNHILYVFKELMQNVAHVHVQIGSTVEELSSLPAYQPLTNVTDIKYILSKYLENLLLAGQTVLFNLQSGELYHITEHYNQLPINKVDKSYVAIPFLDETQEVSGVVMPLSSATKLSETTLLLQNEDEYFLLSTEETITQVSDWFKDNGGSSTDIEQLKELNFL